MKAKEDHNTQFSNDSGAAAGALPPESRHPARPRSASDASLNENGGQTTISPPSKVNSSSSDSLIYLESGIDTLHIALNISWFTNTFFNFLANLKAKALRADAPVTHFLSISRYGEKWPFSLPPYGRKGYEWILEGREWNLMIGGWKEPKTRPSVFVEIRSETLWHLSPKVAVEKIIDLLETAGGNIQTVKASRVDLALDVLMPGDLWSDNLREYAVTRAHDIKPYYKNGDFTGLGIGAGKISARLYDKAREIQTKSKKFWMFDIWGIEDVPEGYRAIRVEFQLRREAIKELGLSSPVDLFEFGKNAWAYCSKNWLKFQDRPGCHHTQRKTLPWWTQIQDGYSGAQDASPLIRAKAIRADKKQIMQQTYGLLSSLTALWREQMGDSLEAPATLDDAFAALFEGLEEVKDKDFAEMVLGKVAKYYRAKQKEEEVELKRRESGFPNGQ